MLPKNLGTVDENDKSNTEGKKNEQEKDLSHIILLKDGPIYKDQGNIVNI